MMMIDLTFDARHTEDFLKRRWLSIQEQLITSRKEQDVIVEHAEMERAWSSAVNPLFSSTNNDFTSTLRSAYLKVLEDKRRRLNRAPGRVVEQRPEQREQRQEDKIAAIASPRQDLLPFVKPEAFEDRSDVVSDRWADEMSQWDLAPKKTEKLEDTREGHRGSRQNSPATRNEHGKKSGKTKMEYRMKPQSRPANPTEPQKPTATTSDIAQKQHEASTSSVGTIANTAEETSEKATEVKTEDSESASLASTDKPKKKKKKSKTKANVPLDASPNVAPMTDVQDDAMDIDSCSDVTDPPSTSPTSLSRRKSKKAESESKALIVAPSEEEVPRNSPVPSRVSGDADISWDEGLAQLSVTGSRAHQCLERVPIELAKYMERRSGNLKSSVRANWFTGAGMLSASKKFKGTDQAQWRKTIKDGVSFSNTDGEKKAPPNTHMFENEMPLHPNFMNADSIFGSDSIFADITELLSGHRNNPMKKMRLTQGRAGDALSCGRAGCGATTTDDRPFKTCARCYTAYCSKECQRDDWGRHRFLCKANINGEQSYYEQRKRDAAAMTFCSVATLITISYAQWFAKMGKGVCIVVCKDFLETTSESELPHIFCFYLPLSDLTGDNCPFPSSLKKYQAEIVAAMTAHDQNSACVATVTIDLAGFVQIFQNNLPRLQLKLHKRSYTEAFKMDAWSFRNNELVLINTTN